MKRKPKLTPAETAGLHIAHLLMSEGWAPDRVSRATPAMVSILAATESTVDLAEQARKLLGRPESLTATTLGELDAMAREKSLRFHLVAIPNRLGGGDDE